MWARPGANGGLVRVGVTDFAEVPSATWSMLAFPGLAKPSMPGDLAATLSLSKRQ